MKYKVTFKSVTTLVVEANSEDDAVRFAVYRPIYDNLTNIKEISTNDMVTAEELQEVGDGKNRKD
ncbi:hypothetical protein JZO86_06050 [Enterococcus ureasiticus]|uniref:hypothetical protein n=1 Tax=Enterococcus ureasiticus TaxID=903984 RepID=UPI001A90A6CB|nr:hypothetical protein [Enterococcus ureasiticus]MBO0473262.1 hypothetical protein [Enterococcus ureasiticus]